MKFMRLFAFLIVLAFVSDPAFAVKITAQDTEAYVFADGNWQKDPHRFTSVFEIDQTGMMLRGLEERDQRTGDVWTAGDFRILAKPQEPIFSEGNPLKAMRVDPRNATVEVITFNDGRYIYSRTNDDELKVYYGNYKLDF